MSAGPVAVAAKQTDDQLITLMAAGSTDALGVLYDRYAARALRVARAVCPEAHAEEAVQEAFVDIWRGRGTYRARRGTAAAWVLAIVHNRGVDVARRHSRHAGRQTDSAALEHRVAPADVSGQVTDGAEAGELRAHLARLPAAQRDVITLAFYGQLSHREIAEHLGLPPGTVKGRMRLGLQKLRQGVDRSVA